MTRVIALLLFISFNIQAQQIQEVLKYNAASLDSLLFNLEIKAFIETWESLVDPAKKLNISAEEAKNYRILYKNILQIPYTDEKRLQELCLNFQKSIIDEKYIYPKIELLYQRFHNAISAEQWQQALSFYYIGRYFRNKKIELDKTRIRQNYQNAQKFYLYGDYDDALNLIEAFKEEDPQNPGFIILKDSLEFLYNKLEENTKLKISIHKTMSNIVPIRKQFTISFNFNYFFPNTIGNEIIVLHHRTYRDLNVQFGPLLNEDNNSYKLAVDFYISPKISIGARVGVDIINNKSEINAFNEPVYIKGKAFTIGNTGTYFLNDNSWLRPYLRIEAGILKVIRNKVELNPSDSWYAEYDQTDELNVIYPQVFLETGTEIEFGENSPVYLGLNLFLFNHFGDSRVINHFIFGGGIVLGVNLL